MMTQHKPFAFCSSRTSCRNLCKLAALAIALITLSGAGYAQSLTATPPSLSFGSVPINMTSDPQSVTLTDLGTAPFTFTAAPILSGPNASEFSVVPLPTGCLIGEVLAINGSCTISVSFTPTAIGAATATLSVPGAVGLNGVPLSVTLSGKGVSPPIVVDANTVPCVNYKPHYLDIQTAVNNALPGATIAVCPGTYAQQITINKSLTLRGVTNTAANTGAAVIAPPPASPPGIVPATGLMVSNGFVPFGSNTPTAAQVLVQASNVNIVDIAVDGAGAFTGCSSPSLVGIGFDTGSSGTLRRVAVRSQNIPNGSGGYCGNGTTPFSVGIGSLAGSVTVQDSSVRGFGTSGFVSESTSIAINTTVFVPISGASSGFCVSAAAVTMQISNNTIANCSAAGLLASFSGQSTITGNTITNTGVGIDCEVNCSGGNVSYNTIADTAGPGIGELFSPGFSGTTFQYNDISGASAGISLGSQSSGNTVRYNTINDASFGIIGITNNNVSNNTFLNVTTLTQ